MTPECWQRVDEIFQAAIELKAEERSAFIESACAGDEDLRLEVESLMTADEHGLSFVDEPAFQVAAGLLATLEPELNEGQSIGHYEIIGLIGRGGMGEVYLAKDKLLGRRIALKLLLADHTRNQDHLRRFQQEAQAASALNHPNILTIYELGQINGQQFIATEFVEGETLRQRIKPAPLHLRETLDLAIQIGNGLLAAHAAGITHRDIKPENIMVRKDGLVKILDFGLAKLTEQQESPIGAQADSGLLIGTVKYMSPELARGLAVDPRSDIFSFGVTLYEMLAGRMPFEGKNSSERIAAIVEKEQAPLTNVPDEMKHLVNRALCKNKEERYQTIEALLTDLKSLQQDKVVSRAEAVKSVIRGVKRHKIAAVLSFVSLVLFGVSLTFVMNRPGSKLRSNHNQMKITRIPGTDKAASVAISPNGEYIAYAEMDGVPANPGGDQSLWVLQVATDHRTQIRPPAHFFYDSLTYSRDGRDIFYVSDNVLYRIPEGGGEVTKVLSDVWWSISFAPDGKQFAFMRFLNSTETVLMVANVDGSGEHEVARRKTPEFLCPSGPAWSPDGSLIACALTSIAENSKTRLIGFDVRTREEKTITDQKWDAVGEMVWLPDASSLIIVADQIWEIPYPNPKGEAHRVTTDLNYRYSHLGLTDNSKLVALLTGRRSSLWLMPDGNPSAARPITSPSEYQDFKHVSWTPDGKILYASNDGTSRDIWVMNGDGTNPQRLTANAGENRQPQPCDGYIVFTSTRANVNGNVWRMNMDGTNPVRLTHGNGESQPVCSPDGHWVVYSVGGIASTPEEKTLWKAPLDGGKPVILSNRPSSGAAVSPDGTLIASWYQPDSAARSKLALIPFEGGPPIKIFDVTKTGIHPARWSLDGLAITYINAGNIWSQAVSGGPPKRITQFPSEAIEGFDWSPDGKLICARSESVQDAVLITDFR